MQQNARHTIAFGEAQGDARLVADRRKESTSGMPTQFYMKRDGHRHDTRRKHTEHTGMYVYI